MGQRHGYGGEVSMVCLGGRFLLVEFFAPERNENVGIRNRTEEKEREKDGSMAALKPSGSTFQRHGKTVM